MSCPSSDMFRNPKLPNYIEEHSYPSRAGRLHCMHVINKRSRMSSVFTLSWIFFGASTILVGAVLPEYMYPRERVSGSRC